MALRIETCRELYRPIPLTPKSLDLGTAPSLRLAVLARALNLAVNDIKSGVVCSRRIVRIKSAISLGFLAPAFS